MLKGRRVLLRPVRRSDINYFLKWFNDLEVIENLAAYLPMTEMAEEKWIEELGTKQKESDVVFVIEVIRQKKSIGICGLHQISHKDQRAVFGITIGEKSYWGKGYGPEAARLIIDYGFRYLNLNKISSSVLHFNGRSKKLHERVGFQEEGYLRKNRFKNGEFCDEYVYGFLREEWKGLQ